MGLRQGTQAFQPYGIEALEEESQEIFKSRDDALFARGAAAGVLKRGAHIELGEPAETADRTR
jgi:hypothetical protein